jgi:hypothetical protein
MLEYLLGGVANEEARHSGPTLRSHHEEVGLRFARELENPVSGLPFQHVCVVADVIEGVSVLCAVLSFIMGALLGLWCDA